MDTDELFDVFTEEENSSSTLLLSKEFLENSELLKRRKKDSTETEDSDTSSSKEESEPENQLKKRKIDDDSLIILDDDETNKNNNDSNNANNDDDKKEFQLTDYFIEEKVDEEKNHSKRSVRHEVVIPKDYQYTSLKGEPLPEKPAREYPFELDLFQKYTINCIERNESALVSAHTSAGKTVVAEYAIAKALQNRQRVIYTSPIKALSNQKYRDFIQEFGDVGLITGDITINPNASCLVMTTEILRSMLYRNSDVIKEISWVIFDEIHYMQHIERGVVWEESIILLPSQIRFIFLSATIPNATQFAEWICQVHQQPCHVLYTDYRPTPLQHYVFPLNGEGIYMAMDGQSEFHTDNFNKAMAVLENRKSEREAKQKRWKNNSKG